MLMGHAMSADVSRNYITSALVIESLRPLRTLFWLYPYWGPSTAKAMMLSSVTGLPKKPPPVDVMTTYCLPSRP